MRAWFRGRMPKGGLRMVFKTMSDYAVTVKVLLAPADEESAVALRDLREETARVSGVRHPDHETYVFHISTAYVLRPFTGSRKAAFAEFLRATGEVYAKEFGVFTSAAPELVFFPHMLRYRADSARDSSDSRS